MDDGKHGSPRTEQLGVYGAFVELRNGSIWGIGRNGGIKTMMDYV